MLILVISGSRKRRRTLILGGPSTCRLAALIFPECHLQPLVKTKMSARVSCIRTWPLVVRMAPDDYLQDF